MRLQSSPFAKARVAPALRFLSSWLCNRRMVLLTLQSPLKTASKKLQPFSSSACLRFRALWTARRVCRTAARCHCQLHILHDDLVVFRCIRAPHAQIQLTQAPVQWARPSSSPSLTSACARSPHRESTAASDGVWVSVEYGI